MADNMELKACTAFEIKDAERGEVEAVVATIGVVDRDGDVIFPGAIPDGVKVKLSEYDHAILEKGVPPVGAGTISVKGDRAIFSGRYFMTTERGREAFHTAKELGPDSEWSFGFVRSATKTVPMTAEWRAKGARRLIVGLDAREASPVFVGAGIGTGTLATKAADVVEPLDPAIEAARLKAKADAKAAEELNSRADRMFRRAKVRR